MSIIIYLILLVFLLIIFILFTAIGLTFKFNFMSLEERKEFGGTFKIKWLLFSHTFSFEDLKAKESPSEEPYKSKPERDVIIETGDWRDKTESTVSTEKGREIEEKTEVKEITKDKDRLEIKDSPEIKRKDDRKKSLIDKIRDKIRVKKKDKVKLEKEDKVKLEKEEKVEPVLLTKREMLYWGLKAIRELKKPFLRLISDLLRGIKIKNLDSRLIFGLSDPADTGMLCGFIHAVAGLIYSRCTHCSFLIRPVFMNPMLDFREDAEIRVRIYSMIIPFIKFIFNRNTLSFIYAFGKEIFRKKWESEWEPKWKSMWKFNWKSKSKSNS